MAVDTGTPAGNVATDDTPGSTPDRPFRPSVGGWLARGVVWAGLAALVFLWPLTREAFEMIDLTTAVVYGIIGLSLNVLLGYVGQISLGHQAFVGIGAFTSAYMVTEQGQSFWVGVAAATIVGALQALVLGAVSLRITGLYFALVTLSYGLVAQENIFQIEELTGGGQGQPAPKPNGFDGDLAYYYLCLGFLALVLWLDWRLLKTKGGRALLALRENPRVASTFGVNVRLATLFAFVVSGAYAGLAGALLAHNETFVSPVDWNFQLALVFVIMTVVGGLRSRAGVIIGSAFFALMPYLVDKIPGLDSFLEWLPGNMTPEIFPYVLGPLLLLLTLVMYPGGIGQQIRPLQGWLRGRRFDVHDRGLKEVQITDVRA
jgi:branched-chain amino acid transport system permease protein